jgi:hypothetical protein
MGVTVQKLLQTLKNMHATPSMLYTYFVSTAITVKSQWGDIDHFFPKWLQGTVITVATIGYVIDKVRRSLPQDPPAP